MDVKYMLGDLKSGGIHLPPRQPRHSSPCHRAFRVTESLTLAAFRLGQQPARSVLTSAEPGQKICSDCVFSRDEADTSDSVLAHLCTHRDRRSVK